MNISPARQVEAQGGQTLWEKTESELRGRSSPLLMSRELISIINENSSGELNSA